MPRDVIIYMSSFIGMSLLWAVFGCFICCRHLRHAERQRERVLCLQSLRQQAIDQNMPPLYVDHGRDPVYVLMPELSLHTTATALESAPASAPAGVDADDHDPPLEIDLSEVLSRNDPREHNLLPDPADRHVRDAPHLEHEDQQLEDLGGSVSLPYVSPPPYDST